MSVFLSVSASIYQCLRVGSFCAEKVCSSINFFKFVSTFTLIQEVCLYDHAYEGGGIFLIFCS